MKNPYEVLEIKEGASKAEIKKAYLAMVKKYHPDQYYDNPLSELVEEKLREANLAYEYLMGEGFLYGQVKANIDRGNIDEADRILDGMSQSTAEWHYLKGLVSLKRGWYDAAYSYMETAAQLDPNTSKYEEALRMLKNSNTDYRQASASKGATKDSELCEFCTFMFLADCCCEFTGEICRSC